MLVTFFGVGVPPSQSVALTLIVTVSGVVPLGLSGGLKVICPDTVPQLKIPDPCVWFATAGAAPATPQVPTTATLIAPARTTDALPRCIVPSRLRTPPLIVSIRVVARLKAEDGQSRGGRSRSGLDRYLGDV